MTRYDDLESLKRRLAAWKAEVGTNSRFAAAAPSVVAQLEAEIAERKGKGIGQ